jgi:hypothetical protein
VLDASCDGRETTSTGAANGDQMNVYCTYVDRYATDWYGEPVILLECIDRADAVEDLNLGGPAMPQPAFGAGIWHFASCVDQIAEGG